MQSIRQVARLNEAELEKCVPPNASWHTDYRDTAYIYIGGLPFELSEGDVLTIFSQYGNPVDVKLMRDKDTGKSRGFCFLKYEDQRSCDLAVDNLSGAGVLGRVLSVDHTRYAKKEGEVETVGEEEEVVVEDAGDDTDREGDERRKRRRSESESEDDRPRLREEVELAKLEAEHDDDDPMKAYLIEQKKAEVTEARERESKRKRKHSHRSHHKHRNGDDEKKASERDGPRSHRKRDAEEEEDRRRRSHRSHRSKRERSISSGRSED